MDITFHYPPELLALLVDAIPLLCRSKPDTILFLRGAGVSAQLTSDLEERIRTNRQDVTKYEIVRVVLTRLNEKGEAAIRPRREILKRVVEYDNFTTCWETDRLKAQGLVTQIQKLVDVKDSFTRMREERDRERTEHMARQEAEALKIESATKLLDQTRREFYSLFGMTDSKLRGKKLEGVLNQLFLAFDISVREAFYLLGGEGEGIVEQIDGVIELDGHQYLVEMKWWKAPVGVPEISQHVSRIFVRADARAIIISASEFTAPAISLCKDVLAHKVVTLCTLQELVALLEKRSDLKEFLRAKIRAAVVDKSPYVTALP